ncbi:unnamed protein product [Ilex paraguariensis]|uniref:Uncharacterized protein n=1 Tax=Ilex paraguariensis TaxID=185542 RepID=A0ABC8TJX5_9AQUA
MEKRDNDKVEPSERSLSSQFYVLTFSWELGLRAFIAVRWLTWRIPRDQKARKETIGGNGNAEEESGFGSGRQWAAIDGDGAMNGAGVRVAGLSNLVVMTIMVR